MSGIIDLEVTHLISWLVNHWVDVVVPLLVFLAAGALGLWTRLTVHKIIKQQWQKTGWIQQFVIDTVWHPFLWWFLFLGTYSAIQISILSPTVKRLVGNGVASLFVLSLMSVAVSLSGKLIRFYLGKVDPRQSPISLALNAVRCVVALVGILTILDIWGAPTQPIVIVLAASLFILGLALRNTIDNLLGGLEIIFGKHIKVGYLIRLGSGEAGYVAQISWTKTILKTSEGNLVIVPNGKLMTNTVVNYGTAAAESVANDVQGDLSTVPPKRPFDTLTDREREVLKLIGTGATNHEIAQKLIISEHTVKSHLRSILNKLNVRNRQQAAVYAEREGLIAVTDELKTNP